MAPQFRILGPLEVDGARSLGGARARAVLRTLLLSANQVVTTDRLLKRGTYRLLAEARDAAGNRRAARP